MASAGIDFHDALASGQWAIRASGFKAVVEVVLNTSRVHNAQLRPAGMMRRAELEAATQQNREAFGHKIAVLPTGNGRCLGSQQSVAMPSLWDIWTDCAGRSISLGQADDTVRAVFRGRQHEPVLHRDSAATDVIRQAIESLGWKRSDGDFSVLPRLRDGIVIEAWEERTTCCVRRFCVICKSSSCIARSFLCQSAPEPVRRLISLHRCEQQTETLLLSGWRKRRSPFVM